MITIPEAPNEPQELWYRDILECIQYLLGYSWGAKLSFKAKKLISKITNERFYNEMWTGKEWPKIQVCHVLFSYLQLQLMFWPCRRG